MGRTSDKIEASIKLPGSRHKVTKSSGRKFERILTIEDGIVRGGMGSAVLEFMADNEYKPTVKRIGIPNIFVEHGAVNELYHVCGMDEEGILTKIKEFIN